MQRVRDMELASAAEAFQAQQRQWASQVVIEPGDALARRIAAADVAYAIDGDEAFAAVVVVDSDSWQVIARSSWVGKAPHEYESGAFSLREAGCLIPALEALDTTPDVLLIDGHGIAHPRRFGLACHLGLLFDVATVGCAKTLLCGEHGELASERGATAAIVDGGETIGAALRTQSGVKPMYVSAGYRFDLATACDLIMRCAPRYRTPEPIRQAHHMSITLRRSGVGE